MLRYVACPRALIEDQEQQMRVATAPQLTVFEPEKNSRDTGILNSRGDPIYAVSQIEPIGFVPAKEI